MLYLIYHFASGDDVTRKKAHTAVCILLDLFSKVTCKTANIIMEDMIPFHGLRAVCAMAIFLGHQMDIFLASPQALLQGSSTPVSVTSQKNNEDENNDVMIGLEYLQAVSIFFFLSGIPLVRLYSRTGKVHTWQGCFEFYKKRWARLAPIYYLTLVLNLILIFIICQQVNIHETFISLGGCAIFLQCWFISFIDVGGVLWQIAVFVYGYLIFPFISSKVSMWNESRLIIGIIILWLISAGLWSLVLFLFPSSSSSSEL